MSNAPRHRPAPAWRLSRIRAAWRGAWGPLTKQQRERAKRTKP